MNYLLSIKYNKAETSGIFSSGCCGHGYRPAQFHHCSGSALFFHLFEDGLKEEMIILTNHQLTVSSSSCEFKTAVDFSLNCLEIWLRQEFESKTNPRFLAHDDSAVSRAGCKANLSLFLPQAVSFEVKARLAFAFKRLMEMRWMVSVQNMHLSPCRAKKSLFVL